MFAVNFNEAVQLLEDVAIRNRMAVCIAGQPGIGKSDMARLLAKRHSARLVDIRLSQYDSVDLRGIPSIRNVVIPPQVLPGEHLSAQDIAALSTHTTTTAWNLPATLPFKGNPNFNENDELIILFLDELGSAQPAVQAPAYQLTLDRSVGEHVLMDNVVIIAATNRDGDKGVHHRMATPLANRFVWAELVPDVEASTLYAQEQGWPAVWSAFINFRKPLLSTFDDVMQKAPTTKAFATPRSWAKAMMFYADQQMSLRTKQIAIAGSVGEGPAADFWSFVDIWQSVATYMPRILKEPTTVDLPTEMGLTYAIAVSVSGNMDTKNVATYHSYLVRLDPEYVILAWQLGINRDKALMGTPEFLDFAKRYKAIF